MRSPPDDPHANLAQAFHDLRTPLTVLRGRIYLMRRRLPRTAALVPLLDDLDHQITTLCEDLDRLEQLVDRCP